MIDSLITFFLSFAPLPSFIAWSKGATGLSGFMAAHLGPVNPLKLAVPLFVYYFWKNRSHFEKRFLRFLEVLFFAGTLFTLYAGIRCGRPWMEMREWAVMVLGIICGGCFLALPKRKALFVCSLWMGILLLSVCMELGTPNTLKWLVSHLFDPARANLDQHGIMGFWDIGSLAKMSMMVIWIYGALLFQESKIDTRFKWAILAGLGFVFFLIILGTTQRGPILGMAAGAFALVIQEVRRTRAWKPLAVVAGLGILAAGAGFAILPHQILIPRIRTMFLLPDQSQYGKFSTASIDERFRINRLNYATIRAYPMGNACISPETYRQYDVTENYHAHSLLLQQFRAKGWIWGSLHLAVWLWALAAAFRRKSESGSLIFAGIFSVFALGFVDHPWFVLNQATMIGTLLLSPFLID